jgi:hypothetical protein
LLSLSIREWKCPSCVCVYDRDVNAAKNIFIMALADSLDLRRSSTAMLLSVSAKSPSLERIFLFSQEGSLMGTTANYKICGIGIIITIRLKNSNT